MIYYLSWLMLMLVGLLVSVLLFLWALQSGQFSEQSRARYLPLVGEAQAAHSVRKADKERYALVALFAGALCALLITFFVALMKWWG